MARAGRPESYRTRSLCARFVASALAVLLFAGCAGAPAPLEDHDDFSRQQPADALTLQSEHLPQTDVVAHDTDWVGLSSDLESALQGVPDKRIDLLPEGLRVQLPAAHGFATGKTDISPTFAATIQRIAPVLDRHPNTHLRIVSHTDSSGNEMFNLRLTIQRAEAVMEHLRRQGVDPARMSASGLGETEPIADNAKSEGRARNRRIEIFLSSQAESADVPDVPDVIDNPALN